MYRKFLSLLKNITVSFEKMINFLTTQEHNPLYFHGAIPLYIFWFLIFSGILLWMYYIPTLERAWSSVNYISALPIIQKGTVSLADPASGIPYGSIIRGIHRYGAAGMMIATILHMLRVYFTDRHRSWRWFPWITGVALLVLVLFVGITGYLLVWDNRAYALTVWTQSFIAAIPLIGASLSNFFIAGDVITDYTLIRFFFFHVGGAALIFVLMWTHFIRLKYPVVTPSRSTNFLVLGFILVAAGAIPAINITQELIAKYPSLSDQAAYIASDAPANIGSLVSNVRYDVWYMFPYYLIEKLGITGAWWVLGVSTILLIVAP
ncbi:MAG: cytochrome b N-terminal domain-containing protein, partial [Holophagaceae bacterium]